MLLACLGVWWAMGPHGQERGPGRRLTLPELQCGVHELHHVLHIEEHLREVAAGQHIHEHGQEVIGPVGLAWEEEGGRRW